MTQNHVQMKRSIDGLCSTSESRGDGGDDDDDDVNLQKCSINKKSCILLFFSFYVFSILLFLIRSDIQMVR